MDAFLFLFLERLGIRNLEAFFGFLIGIMAMSFGYMYVDAGVDLGDVVSGLLVRFSVAILQLHNPDRTPFGTYAAPL